MTAALAMEDRAVLRVSGADAREFLQGIVTNDVASIDGAPVYAALLSPQGKYLFDFIMVADGADILLDVAAERAPALVQRLSLYRLRADVTIEPAGLTVVVGEGDAPDAPILFTDPRHPELGWRAIVEDPAGFCAGVKPLAPEQVIARRVALGVPESGFELRPEESFILEMGFERLHGVDFHKGCYVGQEVTARMKHKTALRKGLARVEIGGDAPPSGTEIMAGEKTAGVLWTSAGGEGLAYLRFDRIAPDMTAGSARITPIEGSW